MIFNSLVFGVFFALVLAVHHVAPLSWRLRKASLLAFSLVFYAAWNPPFVGLLLLSTGVDFVLAKAIHRQALGSGRRRALLLASLAVNLGLLGYFKYAGFAVETVEAVGNALGASSLSFGRPDIILPVGISFYTFQTLSYTLDVYRGHAEPCDSLLDFALFVSFFPQLVAGPIVRPDEFLPQCREARRFNGDELGLGLAFITVGLGSKVIVADRLLAPIADKVYAPGAHAAFFEAWCGTVAFAGQIFCDFSGYSMCAIGAALCLGFYLPRNFHFPYAAVGFSDFWRRWHISLSAWLRDYLYISLGGNRGGRARTLVNLQLTMLIGGLWHGASWNFVIWGGLHGALLVLERGCRALGERLGVRSLGSFRVAAAAATFAAVCFTWVFFRARTFTEATAIAASMLGLGSAAESHLLGRGDMIVTLGIMGTLIGGQWLAREGTLEEIAVRVPWFVRSAVLAGVFLVLILTSGDQRAFVYFQF